ncbi:MAG: hypothetical protein KJZ93_24695 [Caldilineaceae bacterium]|nr:hypothetical protein [Caldilineaceae bacterium]
MNRILLNRLLESLRHAWGHAEGGDRPSAPGRDGVFSGYTASPWSHLWGRSPELLNVEDEVAGERQGRLVVYSQQGALCSTLLGRHRQHPSPASLRAKASSPWLTCRPPGRDPATSNPIPARARQMRGGPRRGSGATGGPAPWMPPT